MFVGNKELAILGWLLKLLAPCAVAYISSSQHPFLKDMKPAKKMALIALLGALNGNDDQVKNALKQAKVEVLKIQGV